MNRDILKGMRARVRRALPRPWQRAAAGAGAACALVLLVILIASGGGGRPANPWTWIRPASSARVYLDLEGLRATEPGRRLLAAGQTALGGTWPSLWGAVAGTSELGSVARVHAGVKLPTGAAESGQLVAILCGNFDCARIHQTLADATAISFTRTVGSYQAHRLRFGSAVPPELMLIADDLIVLCDAQSTADAVEAARGEGAAVAVPAGALLWAEARIGTAEAARLGAALPGGVTGLGVVIEGRAEPRGIELVVRLRPQGSTEAVAELTRERVAALPFFQAGPDGTPPLVPLAIATTDREVTLTVVVSAAALGVFLPPADGAR